jgi:hypothetical protein
MGLRHPDHDFLPLERDVVKRLASEIPNWLEDWEHIEAFKPHMATLREVIARCTSGDVLAAFSLLWPKVEGLLRTRFPGNFKLEPSRKKLVDGLEALLPAASPLLPRDFERFLGSFWFAPFDPATNTGAFGRHLLSHGVDADNIAKDDVLVTKLLLLVDQLSFAYRRLEIPAFPAEDASGEAAAP